jgi:hypothetical protein
MVCCPLTTSRAKGSSCSTNGSSCFIMGGPWFLSCPSREPTAPFSGERLSSASSGAKRCVMGDTTGLHRVWVRVRVRDLGLGLGSLTLTLP